VAAAVFILRMVEPELRERELMVVEMLGRIQVQVETLEPLTQVVVVGVVL
jgi:hypothetical protein